MAQAGFGSRREIEAWINEGRVKLNGQTAKLGDRYTLGDQLTLDGKPVGPGRLSTKPARVLLYHKPMGEVTTVKDPEGRPTVFDNLPRARGQKWISIGRLDINTSGLIIFTTDGELANKLMHPSNNFEREYAVRVLGEVKDEVINALLKGVELEDGPAKFDRILDAGGTGANHWYHVILREGRNREVRRMWESQGVTVSRLMRIRFGAISLPSSLKQGKWIELEEKDVKKLIASL